MAALTLSQLSAELRGKVVDKFFHDSVDLFVVQRLVLVFKDEVDGIALLAIRQVLALIDIEEFDTLQKFLLALVGDLLDLRKLHVVVNQQSQVTADRRIFAEFLELYLVLLDSLEDAGPVKLCVEDILVDTLRCQHLVGELAVVDECLARAIVECDTFREDVVLAVSLYKHVRSYTSTLQDVVDISLQLENRSILVGMCPRALDKFTCQPKSEMIVLSIGLDRSLRRILLSSIAIDISHLKDSV